MASRITEFPGWEPDYRITELIWDGKGQFIDEYTGIPADRIESHIKSIAEKGWDIVHYPCFGMFWFLHFDLAGSPIYDEIVAKVKEGALLLDLGCALGQDIRRLVYDGAPQEHLIGLDLRQEFIDLGFELFQDRTSLHSTFVAQDFLDDAQSLEPWAGNLKIINSGYFMHLWGWEGQLNVAKRIVSLLSLQGGSIVTGVHFGSEETGHTTKVPENVDPLFLHDCDTLKRLWEQVGRETQTRVSVWMATERDEDYLRLDPKAFRLRWYVRLWRD